MLAKNVNSITNYGQNYCCSYWDYPDMNKKNIHVTVYLQIRSNSP